MRGGEADGYRARADLLLYRQAPLWGRLNGATLSLVFTVAAAAALAALGAAAPAHASPPALPCDFECQWPMGTHSDIPSMMNVGQVYPISWWYAWEEDAANPAIGALADRVPPKDHYSWPEEWGAPEPPPGYAGSEVTLRLPEEFELVGNTELARSLLWVDGNGRATYEYTATLAYQPNSGAHNMVINIMLTEPVAYEDTELYVDLGLSKTDAAPPVWLVNNAPGNAATVSTELPPVDLADPVAGSFAETLEAITANPAPVASPAAHAAAARAAGGAGGAAGGAGGAVGGAAGAGGQATPTIIPELRHTYVFPPPTITPISADDLPDEVTAFTGVQGASAANQVLAHGKINVHDRDGVVVPATNALVCLYDQIDDGDPVIIRHTGNIACRFIDSSGNFVVAVPSTDPDGTGGPDILARVFTFNNFVQVRFPTPEGTISLYRYDLPTVNDAPPGVHSFGDVTIPQTLDFNTAYWPLDEITEAHEFFDSTFGYNAPSVTVTFHPTENASYSPSGVRIVLKGTPTAPATVSTRHTALHEYGHHIQSSVYGQVLPYASACNPHYFDFPSSEECAWIEGWAHFVASLVDDTHLGRMTSSLVWNLESGTIDRSNGIVMATGHGDSVEARISALLWDLHDSTEEQGDTISGGAQMIWDALIRPPESPSELPALTIHEFREDWEAQGHPNLGEAFAINTIPSYPRQPASLSVHAEDGGSPKSGAGSRHASVGQSVVITLGLASPAPAGSDPTASFFGGAPVQMSPAGADRRTWSATYTVTGSTPDGTAVFRVLAAGTEYTPASITSGGNVIIDTTAPKAPIPSFTSRTHVLLAFDEPLLPSSIPSAAFTVTPSGGTPLTVTASYVPGSDRVMLALGSPAPTGLSTIGVPATIKDLAGNAHAGTSLTISHTHSADLAPTFSIDADSISPHSGGNIELTIEFSQAITGDTSTGEWTVVLRGSSTVISTASPATIMPDDSAPTEDSLSRTVPFTQMTLVTSYPMASNADSLEVSYAPLSSSTNRLAGETALMPTGSSPIPQDLIGVRNPPVIQEVGFVDSRTIRLSLDRPLETSGGPPPFVISQDGACPANPAVPGNPMRGSRPFHGAVTVGISPPLGDAIVEYGAGSTELTLHTSRAPADSTLGHSLITPPARTGTASGGIGPCEISVLRYPVISGEGYAGSPLVPVSGLVATHTDTAPPSVSTAYANSAGSAVSVVFTKPLDADSLQTGSITIEIADVAQDGFTSTGSYAPGSLRVDYSMSPPLAANTDYTITLPGTIKGANGVGIAGDLSFTVRRSADTTISIESASFATPTRIDVTMDRPLLPSSVSLITVSGLGAVTHAYVPRSNIVTLHTENAAMPGSPYTITMPTSVLAHDNVPPASARTHTVTYPASADMAPPTVTLVRVIDVGDSRIDVYFDEALSAPDTSAFEVRRAGTSADLAMSASYEDSSAGGPRVEIDLGSYAPLDGATYVVSVPAVSDGTNTSSAATVTVTHSTAPAVLTAAFTSTNTLRLGLSEPLDAVTLGGMRVIGLGDTDVGYTAGATALTLRTSGTPVDGTDYTIFIPSSVTDATGTHFTDDGSGRPLLNTAVTVAYEDMSPPSVTSAESRTRSTMAVLFDEDVTFADTSRSALRAAHWTVSTASGDDLEVDSVDFPAFSILRTTPPSLVESDSGRTVLLTHATAPQRSALSVSYAPGSDSGAIVDASSASNALGTVAATSALDVRLPLFTSRTITPTTTLIEFDRPVGGFTASSDWTLDLTTPTTISHVGAVAAGTGQVFVPTGTTSITLEHAQVDGSGSPPLVSYAYPDGPVSLFVGSEPLTRWTAPAVDGIAPTVTDTRFVGPRMIALVFSEPLEAETVARAAFSVSIDGGANLLASSGAITHVLRSPTVLLTLAADAAASSHTVTVPTSITDLNGVAYAAPPSPITATYAPLSSPFTAETASETTTLITFATAVSGTTAASEWAINGLPARGIAVESSTMPTATLSSATSITLVHARLGSTAATPAVSYAPPSNGALQTSNGALAAHTAIATDGVAPTSLSAQTSSRTTTEVTFSEPVSFRGTDPADRASKWTVTDGAALAVSSVALKGGTDDTIVIEHAQNSGSSARPILTYTATGDGSLEDAGSNDATHMSSTRDGVEPAAVARFVDNARVPPMSDLEVWFDEEVTQTDAPRYRIPSSVDTATPSYYAAPGLKMTAEDGSEIALYLRQSDTGSVVAGDSIITGLLGTAPMERLVLFFYGDIIDGSAYTITLPPEFTDANGNAPTTVPLTATKGSDTAGPVLEDAEFTGPRTLYAEFDEALKSSTVTGAAFAVTAQGSSANLLAASGAASHDAHSSRVTLMLAADAIEGTTYEISATGDLQDRRGNAHTPADPATAIRDTTPPTATQVRYSDAYTLEITVSEPLDVDTVRNILFNPLGSTLATPYLSYAEDATIVEITTSNVVSSTNIFPEVSIIVPTDVTDANGVPFERTVLFTSHADTTDPAPHTAFTVSPTATLVRFDPVIDRIRLGQDSTPSMRAAHWTVAETHGTTDTSDDTTLAVSDVLIVEDWHSLLLQHAPSSGVGASLSVAYVSGSDDAGRVRDWATPANVLDTDTTIANYGDRFAPGASSLSIALVHDGSAADPSSPRYANVDDTVTFSLTLDEPTGANTPTVDVFGITGGMTASPSGQSSSWTYASTVPSDAAQGELDFGIRAWDSAGNVISVGAADISASESRITIDTLGPAFEATTASAGATAVTFTEPVSGIIVASEWSVGGAAAIGVSPAADVEPEAALLLSGATSLVLWHADLGDTDLMPTVAYRAP